MILYKDQLSIFLDSAVLSDLKKKSYRCICMDIGCGHGHFMANYCQQDEHVFWIGIEITKNRAEKTQKKLMAQLCTNFLIVCADVCEFLMYMPSDLCDRVYINFPDPWPKHKHWKHRLFRPSFMVDLQRVLKIGGEVSFVTDIRSYAETTAKLFLESPFFDSMYDPVIQNDLYKNFPTLFYARMHKLRTISYLLFKKTRDIERMV